MKRNKKLVVAVASFAAASVCLVGGTFAWYVMANTTNTSMSGTMVDVEDMMIGLRSAVNPTTVDKDDVGTKYTLAELNLEQDENDTEVYWSTEATGFKLGTLDIIAGMNGFGNEFSPVTTGEYATGDVIALKDGLSEQNTNTYQDAATAGYYSYTLVFKTKIANEIFLNASSTALSGDTGAVGSLRVGFESDALKTVVDPVLAGKTDGETDVAGRMDLNGDGVWDYVDNEDDTKLYEIVYGEFDEYDAAADDGLKGVSYLADRVANGEDAADGSNKDFLGGASMTGVNAVDTTALTAKKQVNSTIAAHLRGETALVVAGDDGLAELKVTIWSEGWDAQCTNDIKKKDFAVKLGFVSTEPQA